MPVDPSLGLNPKDEVGQHKLRLDLVPPAALAQLALALDHGRRKYSAWNWRETPTQPEIYYGAMLRHLLAWGAGQEQDPESGLHHLAHVMASAAIILDQISGGSLLDWAVPERSEGYAAKLLAWIDEKVEAANRRR